MGQMVADQLTAPAGRRTQPAPSAPVACCAPVTAPRLSDDEAAATAAVFRALGDPHRVRIVNLLSNSDSSVCVCDLVEPLGISQPTVSHHLKKLVTVGLLDREQRGRWAYYSLNREAVRRLADVVDLTDPTPDRPTSRE